MGQCRDTMSNVWQAHLHEHRSLNGANPILVLDQRLFVIHHGSLGPDVPRGTHVVDERIDQGRFPASRGADDCDAYEG